MSEAETDVRRDASADCRICKGAGWHWGWELLAPDKKRIHTGNPIRLRCPCVDQNRAADMQVEWMERGDAS